MNEGPDAPLEALGLKCSGELLIASWLGCLSCCLGFYLSFLVLYGYRSPTDTTRL